MPRTPTNTGKHICPHCALRFGRKFDLLRHVQGKHERTLLWGCTDCKHTTAQRSNMTAHMMARHGSTAEPRAVDLRVSASTAAPTAAPAPVELTAVHLEDIISPDVLLPTLATPASLPPIPMPSLLPPLPTPSLLPPLPTPSLLPPLPTPSLLPPLPMPLLLPPLPTPSLLPPLPVPFLLPSLPMPPPLDFTAQLPPVSFPDNVTTASQHAPKGTTLAPLPPLSDADLDVITALMSYGPISPRPSSSSGSPEPHILDSGVSSASSDLQHF